MQKLVEVYLLAENRLLREVLGRLLRKSSELRIVGSSSYSQVIHDKLVAARPHVVLLDSMGISHLNASLIATLHGAIRNVRIVMVDMDLNEDTFLAAVRAGVAGYVLKNASAAEVMNAVRLVASGNAVCPPSLCMTVFRCIARQSAVPATYCGAELGLSRREQQIVALLRERLTNKEIAWRFKLSEQTVKNHVHHILRKLGSVNRHEVVERCEKQVYSSNLQAPATPPAAASHEMNEHHSRANWMGTRFAVGSTTMDNYRQTMMMKSRQVRPLL